MRKSCAGCKNAEATGRLFMGLRRRLMTSIAEVWRTSHFGPSLQLVPSGLSATNMKPLLPLPV